MVKVVVMLICLLISSCVGPSTSTKSFESEANPTATLSLPTKTPNATSIASATVSPTKTGERVPIYEYTGNYPDVGRLLYEDIQDYVKLYQPRNVFRGLTDPTLLLFGEESNDPDVKLENYYRVWEALANGDVPDMTGLEKGVFIQTPIKNVSKDIILLSREQLIEFQRQNVLVVLDLDKKPEGAGEVYEPLLLTKGDISSVADDPDGHVPALMFGGEDKDFLRSIQAGPNGFFFLSMDRIPEELRIPIDYVSATSFIPLDHESLAEFINRNGLGEGQPFYKAGGVGLSNFFVVRGDKTIEELIK